MTRKKDYNIQHCPKCNREMEWGKKGNPEGSGIIFFWRCPWCSYEGEEIVRL